MSSIKEIAEQEHQRVQAGTLSELHLWREGTFMRAYEWSAFLAGKYLHEFKVNKRAFKGADLPVVFIGFPEASLAKWLPEGVTQTAIDEKHLVLQMPAEMLTDDADTMQRDYTEWHHAIPLTETKERKKRDTAVNQSVAATANPTTLTAIMQQVLAFPIESKSPLESMAFLADIKQQLAALI